jgi:hypothetical protein
MYRHPDFHKELNSAPKDIQDFMIVMKFDSTDKNYVGSFDFRDTEGNITHKEIDQLQAKLTEIPDYYAGRAAFHNRDSFAIIAFLIGIIGLGIGFQFTLRLQKGSSIAIGVIFGLLILLSLIYFMITCWIRKKRVGLRMEAVERVIEEAQSEIFSPKGAFLTMSPLGSYITIEFLWKYSRIFKNLEEDDVKADFKINGLSEFNRNTFDRVLDGFGDQVLADAIRARLTYHGATQDQYAAGSLFVNGGDGKPKTARSNYVDGISERDGDKSRAGYSVYGDDVSEHAQANNVRTLNGKSNNGVSISERDAHNIPPRNGTAEQQYPADSRRNFS